MGENMNEEAQFTEAQQAKINELVGQARVKAREKAEIDFKAQAEKNTSAAERANLAAQEEWQKLAAQHEARVKELEPFEAEAKAYRELVAGMLKDKVKALGDVARKAIAGLPESLTDLDKLNWLNQNTSLFEGGPGDGVGTPHRSGHKKTAEAILSQPHKKARL